MLHLSFAWVEICRAQKECHHACIHQPWFSIICVSIILSSDKAQANPAITLSKVFPQRESCPGHGTTRHARGESILLAAPSVELLLACLGITKWGGQQWKNREKCLERDEDNSAAFLVFLAFLRTERSKPTLSSVLNDPSMIQYDACSFFPQKHTQSTTGPPPSPSGSCRLPSRRGSYVNPKEGKNKQSRKQNERGACSTLACLCHLNI